MITGGYALLGSHVMRTCRLVKKLTDAKGGVLGQPVEFLFQDTTGDPALCVRKCQELVERDNCRILTGVIVSSEAAAMLPKLEEWNAVFLSHGNGDGRLTAELFVPRFFRANTSAPMGARALALYLKDAPQKKFIAIASDAAWGRSSNAAFEEQIKKVGKDLVDKIFAPVANKDYSPYITKILQSGADGLLRGAAGRRGARVLLPGRAVRAGAAGAVLHRDRGAGGHQGARQGRHRADRILALPDHLRHPAEQGVRRGVPEAEYKNELPDWSDGEMYQALMILFAAIEKAGSPEPMKIVAAMEDLDVTSVKGPVLDAQVRPPGREPGLRRQGRQDREIRRADR